MLIRDRMVGFALQHYRAVAVVLAIFVIATGALIPLIKVDTDPENMLSAHEPARVFHDENKQRFALHDIVVLGVVNEKDPQGVFNVQSLGRIYELAEFAKTLRWPDEQDRARTVGVVEVDLMAPSTVDHIQQGEPGQVRFEWLMSQPPKTEAEAIAVRDRAMSNPMLVGTLISEDAKALCLYLPLTSKDLSYRVYSALRKKTAGSVGDDEYHITGLPVAEDTFGVEMFIQMAISAPLAMLVIFLLKVAFFRKPALVLAPMIVALASVIPTMGLLIGFGFPVHIMSSMIPIFLMPISVVDSVHILSEFFDRYTPQKGRRETVREVMHHLFVAMLYTSLTSAAGFASLALTPIPPVQVFGVFVAIGVMIAWVVTVLFVPAYVMFIPEKMLANFGHAVHRADKPSILTNLLERAGRFTYVRARGILAVMAVLTAVAIYGITRIEINDNPVKWFSKSHPIRRADIALNRHFGGTYMAFLVLDQDTSVQQDVAALAKGVQERLAEAAQRGKEDYPKLPAVAQEAAGWLSGTVAGDATMDGLLARLGEQAQKQADSATDADTQDSWGEVAAFFDLEREWLKPFKQPQTLEYIARLQEHLKATGIVGKSSSVTDIVKKVHQELTDGKAESHRVPDDPRVVAECLLQYQSSHRPDDLWHFVSSDFSSANLWVQLTSGDNRDMEAVVAAADEFFTQNKPPVPMKHAWAGLTYINTVWQDKMVWGMLQSFLGSFLIVFVMMVILFRSALWGLISMIPLLVTILTIYGAIGLVGKDYDMPVAVLSALTLGMAVDFAIHFLERSRMMHEQIGSWEKTAPVMFGEPARAISRNVLVIAIGFLPLLFAPLVPYKTVGVLMCAIMALSGLVTLLALPAIIRLGERRLFRSAKAPLSTRCNCAACLTVSISSVVIVALNVYQFGRLSLNGMLAISLVAVPVMAVICGIMSRRQACRRIDL